MNLNKSNISQNARVLSDMVKRSVKQELEPSIGVKLKFNTIIGRQAWYNGVKETVNQNLFNIEDYDGTNVTIDSFNPSDNKTYSQIFWVTDEKQTSFEIVDKELMNAFTTNETRNNFIAQKMSKVQETWDHFFQDLYAKYIFQLKNIETIKADGTKTSNPIYLDKELSVTIANTTKDVNNMTESEMKKTLEVMRGQLMKFKVHSSVHTKFASDSAADEFFGDFAFADRKKFKFAGEANDFVVVWNANFKNKISSLTATLFNKDDILLKTQELVLPMEEFDFYAGLTSNQKKAISSTVAYIIHKDALRIGYELWEHTDVVHMKFKNVYYQVNFFGFMRNVFYPIIKVKVA